MTDTQEPQVPASGPEPLISRLARLGSMLREDEHKVLVADAVEALCAAEATTPESWIEQYQRRVLRFVEARGYVDLETVTITSGYVVPYQYSEYEGGGGYFAMNVRWKERAPREDAGYTADDADWDGLFPCSAELQNEDVARFLDSLGLG